MGAGWQQGGHARAGRCPYHGDGRPWCWPPAHLPLLYAKAAPGYRPPERAGRSGRFGDGEEVLLGLATLPSWET